MKTYPEIPSDKILIASGEYTKLGDQKWAEEKWIDVVGGLLVGFLDVVVRPRSKHEVVGSVQVKNKEGKSTNEWVTMLINK